MFKDFVEDILTGNINNNSIKKEYKEKFADIEKYLSKSKKSKNVNQLKNYIKKIKEIVSNNEDNNDDNDDNDDNDHNDQNDDSDDKNTPSRIKVDKAKSFKDQKGKGHINLPILLSKIYTNNNSKELINDIKQLVKDLYDNKQITKQVHNILIKATTYKMTHKEQVKTLGDKIKANKRQHDLDRKNAEISAYSSGDLPKYEYLTKKDLEYNSDAFEQAKFEYSPIGKIFTDVLAKEDKSKKVGLFKRLKNIEDNLVEVDDNDKKVGIFRIIKDINDKGTKIDNDDEAVREIR